MSHCKHDHSLVQRNLFEIVSTHMPLLGYWICLLAIMCPLGHPELHAN